MAKNPRRRENRRAATEAAPAERAPILTAWIPKKYFAGIVLAFWALVLGRYVRDPDLAPDWGKWGSWISTFTGLAATSVQWKTAVDYGPPLLGFLWIAALGIGLGHQALRLTKIRFHDVLEHIGFSLGIGWGILALFMAIMGVFRLWYPGLILGILACASLASIPALYLRPPEVEAKAATAPSWSWPEYLLGLTLLGIAAFNLLGALTPEVFYDSLVYHLALPDLYWRHHGFFPVAWNLYSGIPMLTEMLYAVGQLAGGDISAKLIHWALGAATMVMVFSFGNRFATRRTGLIAALAFYSIPLVGVLSWKTAIELGWTFFQFMAVYALALRIASDSPRWTWLAAVFTGLAMGTKYPGWTFAGTAAVSLAWFLKKKGYDRARLLRELGLFTAVTVSTMAIWPLKNVLLYTNPIYPILQERFAGAGPIPDWRGLLHDGNRRDLGKTFGSREGLKDFLIQPWSMTFDQQSDADMIGALFLLSLPLIFLIRFDGAFAAVRLVLILSWAAWTLTTSMARFFVPELPLVALLAAAVVEGGLSLWPRRTAYLVGAFFLCANQYWTCGWFSIYTLEQVSLDLVSRADYLRQTHYSYGNPYYSAVEYVNEHLKPDARLLFIGEARGYYCRRDYVASSLFDLNPMAVWLKESRAPSEIREHLRKEGITHLLVNPAEFSRLNESARWALNPEQKKLFSDFWDRYVRAIYAEKDKPSVYEIIDTDRNAGEVPPNNPLG